MISVGVRDLKNQLSQYLQYVKNGERVIIKEHNRVIAELSLPREDKTIGSVEEELRRLSAMGKVILAARNTSVAHPPQTTPDINWKDVYVVAREDRL